MNDLLDAGVSFIILGAVLFIGAGIMSVAYVQVLNVTGEASSLLDVVNTNMTGVFTTFTGLLPILALALVGGLSLAFLLGFMKH